MNRPPKGEDLKKLNAHMHLLKVTAQDVPNMTVKIAQGNFWANGTILVEYVGGISPLIVKPAHGNKYVCVVINKYGTISIVDGPISTTTIEPALPSVSKDLLPLAIMYIKSDTLIITSDMIYDVRPLFNLGTFSISHTEILNRDAINSHPISAITGLQDELIDRPSIEDFTNELALKADLDGTTSKMFKLSKGESGVANEDIILEFFRGAEGFAAIQFSESNNRLEFTNDGINFYPLTNSGEYYTKTEMDDLLSDKANAADVYIKNEIDIYLDEKANALDVYTKIEVDDALALKADASDTQDALDLKADKIDTYTKTEVDVKFSDLVDGAPGILDTLKEIADALDNDANLATNLANEIATKADLTLVNDVGTAVNNLNDTVNGIGAAINGLNDTINDVGAAVNNLNDTVNDMGMAVNTEVSTRESSDTVLTDNLSTETSVRESSDTVLTDNLSTETSVRESSDAILTDNLSTEVSTRESSDAILTDNLSTEVSTRESSDTILTDNLSTEVSTRESSDTILTDNLSTETSVRESVDLVLSTNISTESSIRASVDLLKINKSDDIKLGLNKKLQIEDEYFPGTYDDLIKVMPSTDSSIIIGDYNTNGLAMLNGKEYKIESALNPGTYQRIATVDSSDIVHLGSGNANETHFHVGGLSGNPAMELKNGGNLLLNKRMLIGSPGGTVMGGEIDIVDVQGLDPNKGTAGIGLASYRDSDIWGSFVYGVRYRGGLNTPAAVQTGDVLMEFGCLGWDGTNALGGGELMWTVDGPVSTGKIPSKAEILVTKADGSTVVGLKIGSDLKITADAFAGNGAEITNLSYAPTLSSDWSSTAPTTVQQALDRMSALLKTLNGGNPIP